MIQRQKLSLNIMTRHLRKRHVPPPPLRAKPCIRYFGISAISDGGFLRKEYHNYWDILGFTSEEIAKIHQNMLTRCGLTPAGQFTSSQVVRFSDRSSVLRLKIIPQPFHSPDLAPSDFVTFLLYLGVNRLTF